jgi:hypothetical protein
MDDGKRYPVPPKPAHLPATRPASVPTLPSSAGGIAFSRRQRQEMDARFSRALSDNLRARTEATKAAADYSDARFDLAVRLSRWNTLDAVIAHEERKGFLSRSSELTVLALELETREINARISRDAAMLALSAYQPQPQQPPMPTAAPQPTAPVGITPEEVEHVLQNFPDMKPEFITPIVMMLRAVLAEKKA